MGYHLDYLFSSPGPGDETRNGWRRARAGSLATLEEALEYAERIIKREKPPSAEIYDDVDDSIDYGSGRLAASYTEDGGWTRH